MKYWGMTLNANQISCYKGKWYVRRFDPDTVENGHIYSSIKEEKVFIYWVFLAGFPRVFVFHSRVSTKTVVCSTHKLFKEVKIRNKTERSLVYLLH